MDFNLRNGKWKNGKETISGRWMWSPHKQRFYIYLDSTDRVTERKREIVVSGDTPEWGNWKLID